MEENVNEGMKYTYFLAAAGFWIGLILGIVLIRREGIPLSGPEYLRLDVLAAAAMMSAAGVGFCADLLRFGSSRRRFIAVSPKVDEEDMGQSSSRKAA